jgi:hypothetical protein
LIIIIEDIFVSKLFLCFRGAFSWMIAIQISIVWLSYPANTFAVEDTTAAEISIWYGQHQYVPSAALAQPQFNLLGRVIDKESDVVALNYAVFHGDTKTAVRGGSINIGPHPLRSPSKVPFGPRRLYHRGDFNILIPKGVLQNGANRVAIQAYNGAGRRSYTEVSLEYQGKLSQEELLPAQFSLQENNQFQVIDGHWSVKDGRIRTLQTGYDRLVALGDTSWDATDVKVSLVVHGIESGKRLPASGPRELGSACLISRWHGHTRKPNRCDQPACGWLPAAAELCLVVNNKREMAFRLAIPGEKTPAMLTKKLAYKPGLVFGLRLQSTPRKNGETHYQARVWPKGTKEPKDWPLKVISKENTLPSGAVALRAHHLDSTFQHIEIKLK